MSGIPLLVLANKIDIESHLEEPTIIKGLNLDYITDNPWAVLSISALHGTNIEQVIQWLLKQKKIVR